MTDSWNSVFDHQPDPENPGWHCWNLSDQTRFNGMLGHLIARPEGERSARLRLMPERRHTNLHDNVHGGAILGLIDIALFAAARTVLGPGLDGAVTLDLTNQFVGAGKPDKALDAVTEVVKETGRFVFLRGIVEQAGEPISSFTGTLRKTSRK